MIKFSRSSFVMWLFGILLLIGTATGANLLLNYSNAQGNISQSSKKKKPTVPFDGAGIVAFGYVDVVPGIATLYPVQLGRVVWVVEEGTTVKKGDVLLRIDNRDKVLQVKRAEADLEDAQKLLEKAQKGPASLQSKIKQQRAFLKSLEHDLASAQEKEKVQKQLFDSEQINVHQLNVVREQIKKVKALIQVEKEKLNELKLVDPQLEIDRAECEVRSKELQLERAKLAVEECTLKAPTDGNVLRVFATQGEVLGPNPKVPAIQFCPKLPRIIRAEVQQEWANRLEVNQDAIIEDDTTAAYKWRGKVKSISDWYTHRRSIIQEPFQFNDVRTLECIIEVTEPEGRPLRIGQRMRVMINQGGP